LLQGARQVGKTYLVNQFCRQEYKNFVCRNKKSLQSYSEKYNPKAMFRLSPRNFIQQNNFYNIPLYAINRILKIIKEHFELAKERILKYMVRSE